MSDRKKKGETSSSNITVGDGKHHLRDDAPQVTRYLKRLGIVCGILLICAVILGLILELVHNHKSAINQQVKSPTQNQKVDINTLNPEEKYHYLASSGNYAGAEATLESQLVSANDTPSKLAIYSQQSAVALQFKKYDDAKKYADKAMQLDPNSDVPYSALAYWAAAQGNKTAATNYWQQAIDKLDVNAPQYALMKRQYQSDITGLK